MDDPRPDILLSANLGLPCYITSWGTGITRCWLSCESSSKYKHDDYCHLGCEHGNWITHALHVYQNWPQTLAYIYHLASSVNLNIGSDTRAMGESVLILSYSVMYIICKHLLDWAWFSVWHLEDVEWRGSFIWILDVNCVSFFWI